MQGAAEAEAGAFAARPAARAPFDFADDEGDEDPLWDGFDDGAAATQVVPQVFDDVTAEVPVIKPPAVNDPFRIGGDELR